MADENKYNFSAVDALHSGKSGYDFSAVDKLHGNKPEASPMAHNVTEGGVLQDLGDLGQGVAQGATLGFADELYGAGHASYDKLKSLVTGNQADDFINLYRKYQKEAEAADEAAKERSPWLHGAGELGGGLITGGAAAGANLALGAGKLGLREAAKLGAGELAKEVSRRAGAAAILGGVAGAGSSKHTLDNLNEAQSLGKDALGGAELGAGLGAGASLLGSTALAESVGNKINKVSGKINQFAEDSPRFRQVLNNFRLGQEGVDTASKTAVENAGLDRINQDVPEDLVARFSKAHRKVDEGLSDALAASPNKISTQDALDVLDRLKASGASDDELAKAQEMLTTLGFKEAPETIPNKLSKTETTTSTMMGEGEPELTPTTKKVTVKGKGLTPEELADAETTLPNLKPKEPQSSNTQILGDSDLTEPIGEVNSVKQAYDQEIPGVPRGEISPEEYFRRYKQYGSQLGDLMQSDTWKTAPAAVKDEIYGLQGTMKQRLAEAVPDFSEASGRINDVSTSFPETLLSKGADPNGAAGVYYRNLKDPEKKLYNAMQNVIEKLGMGGEQATQTYNLFKQNLKALADTENVRKAFAEAGGNTNYKTFFDHFGMSPDEILNTIKSNSDKYAAINSAQRTGETLSSSSLGAVIGKGLFSKTNVIANKVGNYGTKAVQGAERLYNLSDDALRNVASQLDSAGLKSVGAALNSSLNNKNQFLKNAAIFSILQNPNARSLFNGE